MKTEITVRNVNSLLNESHELSQTVCDYYEEAFSSILKRKGHVKPVFIKVQGQPEAVLEVHWRDISTEALESWQDQDEATEYGATGLALLIVACCTEYKVIARSRKGQGFDYWLGQNTDLDFPFKRKARLEVSGINEGTLAEMDLRLSQKLKQTAKSDKTGLPIIIIIAEFSKLVSMLHISQVTR